MAACFKNISRDFRDTKSCNSMCHKGMERDMTETLVSAFDQTLLAGLLPLSFGRKCRGFAVKQCVS